jgi:HAD superfamily hydrolase (TIGR01509 family)
MPRLHAVLWDFGDTLFRRAGEHRAIIDAAAAMGHDVDEELAQRLWADIQTRARTAEERDKGRDLSAELHRQCWTDLYRAADVIAVGLAEALYDMESDPARWMPFADTVPTVTALADRGVPQGVVSDTGFDIRPIFRANGMAEHIGVFVLSYEHGRLKPDPALFELACDELGVSPAETLMVGDNPITDSGAILAGLTSYLLPPAGDAAERGLDAVVRIIGG